MISTYLSRLKAKRLSPKTIELYALELRTLETLGRDRKKIEAHLAQCAPATHSRKLIMWKSYLDSMNDSLLKDFEIPKVTQKAPSFIHGDQIRALLQASVSLNIDSQIFIELGLTLGLRLSEIMQVKSDKVQEGWIRITRKGGNEQFIPLTDSLARKLKGFEGFSRTPNFYRKQLARARKLAGIKERITPHTLRHSFATKAIQSGNDIMTLKEALGHRNLNTTQRYCHVTPESMRKLIRGTE